jgi:hypothetical protein
MPVNQAGLSQLQVEQEQQQSVLIPKAHELTQKKRLN